MIRERVQPIPVLVLTAIWMGLWGELSVLAAVCGLLLAVLVLLAFPLPRLTLGLRLRPLAFVWLMLVFLTDLVRASIQMSWLAIRPGPAASGSEVDVELHSDSDLIRTLTAEMTILVPGSVIVDLTGSTMRMHVIDVHSDEGLAQAVQRVLRTESRIMRAFGAEATS